MGGGGWGGEVAFDLVRLGVTGCDRVVLAMREMCIGVELAGN